MPSLCLKFWGCSESGAISLNKNLDLDAIDLLIQCGLQRRFPAESETFKNLLGEARKAHEDKIRQMQAGIREEVDSRSEELRELFREAIVDNIVNAFPYGASMAPKIVSD